MLAVDLMAFQHMLEKVYKNYQEKELNASCLTWQVLWLFDFLSTMKVQHSVTMYPDIFPHSSETHRDQVMKAM